MNWNPQLRAYADDKLLRPLRELSFIQSHLSRDGNVATLAEAEAYAKEAAADGADYEPINFAARRG